MRDNKFYKIGAIVLIGLTSIIMLFIILGRKSDKKTAQVEENPTSVSSSNVIEETISINNLAELQEISNESNNEKIKNAQESVPSSNKTKQNNSNSEVNNEAMSSKATNKIEGNKTAIDTESKTEEAVDPVFSYPVEGEICTEYAKDKLVYSNTLGEWITHPGVDIKAEKTTVVKASAPGTIKSIKNDPRYGLTVVIEHVNGYNTVYSNLLTAEFVSVGENVSSGQTIGTVGNTASFEILDESHLHFQILKDNEPIDPTMYLKN